MSDLLKKGSKTSRTLFNCYISEENRNRKMGSNEAARKVQSA
jgi:hypothetical protein